MSFCHCLIIIPCHIVSLCHDDSLHVEVDNGVVAYYSVHFPTVSVAGSQSKSEAINSIFWDYMDNRLQPYWPTNQFDGVRIGSRNRRDYYVR